MQNGRSQQGLAATATNPSRKHDILEDITIPPATFITQQEIFMQFASQLTNPQRAQELAHHLSALVSGSAQSIIIFSDGQGTYLGLSGGLGTPTQLRFANPTLQADLNNPAAYSSVWLDIEENNALRPEERAFLNDIAERFCSKSGTISGFSPIAVLSKSLNGGTSLEGSIPLELPFSLNSDALHALVLQHIARLAKAQNRTLVDEITLYSVESNPFARVEFESTITQNQSGLSYQQSARISVVFDLSAGELVGYECTVNGKRVAMPLVAEQYRRLEGILLRNLAHLASTQIQHDGKNWIEFDVPSEAQKLAEERAILQRSVDRLVHRIEQTTTLLEPNLHCRMSEIYPKFGEPHRDMALGRYGVRVVTTQARSVGLFDDNDWSGYELSFRELANRIIHVVNDSGRTITPEHIKSIDTVFHTLKIAVYERPEVRSKRYPNLCAALRGQALDGAIRSAETILEALRALQNEELSYIMVAEKTANLDLCLHSNSSPLMIQLRLGEEYGEMSCTLYKDGDAVAHLPSHEGESLFSQVTTWLDKEIREP